MNIVQNEAQYLIPRKRDLNSRYLAHSKNYLIPAINSPNKFRNLNVI